MRTSALLLALSALAGAGELEERLDAKLKKDFVSNARWVLDYEEALARAEKEGKLVFAYFTRSYSP